MDRDTALRILGLQAGQDVESACRSRRDELDRRIGGAPTDALREKYRAEPADLEKAREVLTSVPSDFRDLPAARPAYTAVPGEAAGARVEIRDGQILAGRYEVRRRLGAGGIDQGMTAAGI